MRQIIGFCALVAVMSALAVQARGAGDAPAGIVAQGKALAEEKCARCHAVGAEEGTGPHEAAPPFRDVVQRYPIENLAEALAEGIVSGHPDMPVFTFEPAEIEAFLAYLDQLRSDAADSVKGK
jgi:mono/diheme cytochrome c family protein